MRSVIRLATATTLLAATAAGAADFQPMPPPSATIVSLPFPMMGEDDLISPYTAALPQASNSGTYRFFRMEGAIEDGDAARLRAAVGQTQPWGDTVLWMNSDGGNFEAGIALGDAITDLNILTYVGPGERCLSACAFAFLGGRAVVNDNGATIPTRQLHMEGELGFHAPSLPGAVPAEVATVPGAAQVLAEEFARPTLANIALLQSRAGRWWLSPDMMARILGKVGQDEFITIDRAYVAMENEILLLGPELTPVTGWGAVEALQSCSLIIGKMLWEGQPEITIPAFGGGFQGWMPGVPFFRTVLADRTLTVTETQAGPVFVWTVDAPLVRKVTCTVTPGAEGPQVMLEGTDLPSWSKVVQTLQQRGPIAVSRLGLLGFGVPWRAIGAEDLYVEDTDGLWDGVPPDLLAAAEADDYCAPQPTIWAGACRFPTAHRAFAVMMRLGERLGERQRYFEVWDTNIRTLCRPQALPPDDDVAELMAGYCALMVAQDLTRIALERLPP